jgi:hypothetical protein
MKIVEKLHAIAEECERGERSPVSGISTWPKETTVEFKAARIIETAMRNLTVISEMNEAVPSEAIRHSAKIMITQLLELCNDPELDS